MKQSVDLVLEPFYSPKKIEDLGMLKGRTPSSEKLRKILKNWTKFDH